MRECGLKLISQMKRLIRLCHSLCGSVDWNLPTFVLCFVCYRHSLCGSVDWNATCLILYIQSIHVTPCAGVWIEIVWCAKVYLYQTGHSLCGSVDWNMGNTNSKLVICVTPCAGVWIEIEHVQGHIQRGAVTPCAGVWIEIRSGLRIWRDSYRHSLCGSVDWNLKMAKIDLGLIRSLPVRECGLKSRYLRL